MLAWWVIYQGQYLKLLASSYKTWQFMMKFFNSEFLLGIYTCTVFSFIFEKAQNILTLFTCMCPQLCNIYVFNTNNIFGLFPDFLFLIRKYMYKRIRIWPSEIWILGVMLSKVCILHFVMRGDKQTGVLTGDSAMYS